MVCDTDMFCLLSSKYLLVVFFQKPHRLIKSLESHNVKLQASGSTEKPWVREGCFHHSFASAQTKAPGIILAFQEGASIPRRIHFPFQNGIATPRSWHRCGARETVLVWLSRIVFSELTKHHCCKNSCSKLTSCFKKVCICSSFQKKKVCFEISTLHITN